MEKHPNFAHERLIGPNGRKTLDSMWNELAESLNCSGGPNKSVNQWKKMWKDKVAAVKLKASELKNAQNQSGINGLTKIKELSEFHIRILSVMSLHYVDGDGETQEGGLNQETLPFIGTSVDEIPGPSQNSAPANETFNEIPGPSLQAIPIESAGSSSGLSRRLTTQEEGRKRKRTTESAKDSFEDPFTVSNDIEKEKLLLLKKTLDVKIEKNKILKENNSILMQTNIILSNFFNVIDNFCKANITHNTTEYEEEFLDSE